MSVMLGCLAIGLYLIIQQDNYVFGAIISLIFGYFAFKEFKEAT